MLFNMMQLTSALSTKVKERLSQGLNIETHNQAEMCIVTWS